MAVISASCSLEAHLAIGAQDYVATDYVAVGYIEHSIESEVVRFIDASVTLSSTASVSVTAGSILDTTVSLTATVTTVVTAQETPEQVSSTIPITATTTVDAKGILAGVASLSSTAGLTVVGGKTFEAQSTFGGTASVSVDTEVMLPFGVHGRPRRFGNQTIRRNTSFEFYDSTVNNMIEFINDQTATKNYMYVPGSELQTTLNPQDPWTLEFFYEPNVFNNDSTSIQQTTKRIFEYYNSADDGDTYIYIDISFNPLQEPATYGVGYRYSDSGASYTIDRSQSSGGDDIKSPDHFAITYDGNTSGDGQGTIQFYFNGKYVTPTAGQFTIDSAGEYIPTTTWVPPSHATSEWRFGDLDEDTDDNHFFLDDIRLTKGLLYPRNPGVSPGGSLVPRFTPPTGDFKLDDITADTVFLINGTNNLRQSNVNMSATSTVSATERAIFDPQPSLTSTSTMSVTAIEVPEQASTTIASTLTTSVNARADFKGTANLASTSTVSVTAQEVLEQAQVNISSTLTTSVQPTRLRFGTASIPTTSTVSVTAVETPEQTSATLTIDSNLNINAGKVGEGDAPLTITSSLTVTGTVGLTVVIQNIPIDAAGTLTVSGDRIRYSSASIPSTATVTASAEELLEQAEINVPITSTVTAVNTRLRNTSVSITSTPGLTVNTIPNVFRILGANTLIIPRQTRTFAIDAQDKTLLIPQQDRLNTVNKQTRILPIPQQTRVLEIEQ